MKSVIKSVLFLSFSAPLLTPFGLWVSTVSSPYSFLWDSTQLVYCSTTRISSICLNSFYSPINLDFFALFTGEFFIFFLAHSCAARIDSWPHNSRYCYKSGPKWGSTNALGVTQRRWLFFMRRTMLKSQELVVERMHSGKGTELTTELKSMKYYWFNI